MQRAKIQIKIKKVLLLGLVLVVLVLGGALADRYFNLSFLDRILPRQVSQKIDQKIVSKESVVVEVAEKVSPSVVTVSAKSPRRRIIGFDLFGGFTSRVEGGTPQDIGSGFIVSSDGLIVTNKHVVSSNDLEYKVITKDGKEHDIISINRDPANDIAVLKINTSGLTPVELGDSDHLKVGQFVVAIGTALGEFRHTVTTGVISGLGRGITAGSVFEGYIEELDNVIQTDAAINPGNSGGPLLNSVGQVIGINVAVAQGAQNIGFAIPVNVVKEALAQYRQSGGFPKKAYLGVQYQMVSQQAAVLNNIPQGAYVVEVMDGSPAESAGIKADDIITKLDGESVSEKKGGLAKLIAKKKAGDQVNLEIWRDGEIINLRVTLSEFNQE